MLNDTHLATLQAMGITLYAPRTHTISFDANSMQSEREVASSSMGLNVPVPPTPTAKRSSVNSASHIDQIKSMLKGKQGSVTPQKSSLAPQTDNTLPNSNAAYDSAQTVPHQKAENSDLQVLQSLVSSQFFEDFQRCVPEAFRDEIMVSERCETAQVVGSQLLLPLRLIVSEPQKKALFLQVLALYGAGESAHDAGKSGYE